ncbi:Uncharacterised protein [Vibrio cholerae]|nr:Uncharacterised protein [Vibrio cholerae]CSI58079.1 Uncharacterised protein [Vibrio cholerae]
MPSVRGMLSFGASVTACTFSSFNPAAVNLPK